MEEDPKRTCMEVALEPFGLLIELERRIETLARARRVEKRTRLWATGRPGRGSSASRSRAATSSGRGHNLL